MMLTFLAILFVVPVILPGSTLGAEEKKPVKLVFLGTAFGRMNYLNMFAAMNVLNKYCPTIRGLIRETSGTGEMVLMTGDKPKKRKNHVLGVSGTSLWRANVGDPLFYKHPYPGLKHVAYMGMAVLCHATLDPNIKSPKDLIGKRIGASPKALGMWPFQKMQLEAWGVLDKVKITHGPWSSNMKALADGGLDVVGFFGQKNLKTGKYIAPGPCAELVSTKQVYFINCPEKDIMKMREIGGWKWPVIHIPAGTFEKDQPAFTATGMKQLGVGAWEDMDEEIVYQMCKYWDKYADTWVQYHRGFAGLTGKLMAELIPVQDPKKIHPGALKYYKEKGYPIGTK